MAAKIRRGDTVKVIAGSSKGQMSSVISVSGDRAVLEGVNIVTKHIKATRNEKGRLEKKPASIHLSNLAHVDENGRPTRVGFLCRDGQKFLILKRDSQKEIRRV